VDFVLACMLAIAGLVFGSFLNVCISRIPRDQSIIHPGSHCPRCGAPIRWYHNIPLVSYVVLRGQCAACAGTISIRYPIVEGLTALLFLACFLKFGLTWSFLKFCIFSFLLLGLIFMDAETGFLPHEFTYPGLVLGLLFAWLAPGDSGGTMFLLQWTGFNHQLDARQFSLLDSAVAVLLGAAFFYFIWAIYYLVRKRHGIGFGDIALIAMCGAFLGLKLTLFVLFTAPVLGSAFAVLLVLKTLRPVKAAANHSEGYRSARELLRNAQVPFGVFLGTSSLLAIFWGEAAWTQYLRWITVR